MRVSSDPRAVVAIGANLGDAKAQVVRALERVRNLSPRGFIASSLWRTTPVDCPPDSPDFINAVCAFVPRPGETPESLLSVLQAMEREFGRGAKIVHNEPRPLDLDLIAFGAETRSTPALTLPHPRAHERRFVIQPLVEIAPKFRAPGWPDTATGLLACLPKGPLLVRIEDSADGQNGRS